MELKKLIKENAYLWMGRCKNGHLLLVSMNGNIEPVFIKSSTKTLDLYFEVALMAHIESFVEILVEIYPGWKSKLYSYGGAISDGVKKVVVTRDVNGTLLKKGIKYFTEKTTLDAFDKFGFDYSEYKYTKIEADNSFNSTITGLECGYNKYPVEAIKYMKDVSEEKNKTLEYPWLSELLKSGVTNAMLLVGGPGTGKSTEFKIFCAQNEVPCYVMQLTAESLATDVTSEFIPNIEDNTSPAKLKRSPFTMAYEYGGIVILDEINMASAGSLSALNSALDGTKQIILADGTVIKRNPNFRCVATMNPDLAGTRELNVATMNRFFTFYWPEINENSFKNKLSNMLGGYSNYRVLEVLWDMFSKLRTIYKSKNYSTEITVRNAELFMKPLLEVPGIEPKYLFDSAFIHCMVQDFSDITQDIQELEMVRDEMLSEFMKVFKPEATVESSFDTKWSTEFDKEVFDFGSEVQF